MTRLTLEYHLRGILQGTVSAVCVRQDIEPDEALGGWKKTGRRYYADPHVEGNREQRSQAEAGSYTTGFTQESGDFCDVFDVPAREALESGDPVAYLDAVAQDPHRRYQERYDAATLLDYHIWPDDPRSHANGVIDAERDDIDVSEWLEAGMTRGSSGCYFSASCERCGEGECLSDPDCHARLGIPVCMTCGLIQPEPQYP